MADKRVLVVHDDPDLSEQIKAGFAASGADYEVISAISGPRAIGMMGAQQPDVIVVDGELEGVDGYALTTQIKADPAGKDVPVDDPLAAAE